jgi:crossover junction endodeoxyribonuclease RuvC
MDPGLSGGVAILTGDGRIESMIVMPRLPDLCALLGKGEFRHAFVEQVSVRPGQGISSGFKFGVGYGGLLGALTARGIPHTLLRPQAWQKIAHVGTSGKDPKDRSDQAAMRLWPQQSWLATPRCKVNHDGLQEACLIAYAGLLSLNKDLA